MKPQLSTGHRSLATVIELIGEEDPAGLHLLDLGCGTGALTFPAAAVARHVTGIDRDGAALEEARARARRDGVANVTFVEGDVEAAAPYDAHLEGGVVEMVVAHLCVSDAIVERAAAVLKSGRCCILASFHTDHWRETGVVSRFAYDAERLRAVLEKHDLGVESLVVETDVRTFASPAEALRYVEASGLKEKFCRSARWANLEVFFERGGRTLTRSICVAKARKR